MAKRRPTPQEEQRWAEICAADREEERRTRMIMTRSALRDALTEGGVLDAENVITALENYLAELLWR